jgi:hypothetical protein
LLKAFKKRDAYVLGVDPAIEIAKAATAEGIKTISNFFTPKLAEVIKQKHGLFNIVIANNVFAHADNLSEILNAIDLTLDKNGIFSFEVSYLVDVYKKTLFDTIYHEHLSYHAVYPLVAFFQKHGFEIIDVIPVTTHGGSIRVISQKQGGPHSIKDSVQAHIDLEHTVGVLNPDELTKFGYQIKKNGEALYQALEQRKSEHKTIIGYGLPAKTTTLTHHYNLGRHFFKYIVDDNPLKQYKYSPGKGVQILPFEAMMEDPPDVVILLAWNFAEAIIKKIHPFLRAGTEIIVPLPKLTIHTR